MTKKLLVTALTLVCSATCATALSACAHEHSYTGDWGKDETGHWRECSADDGAKSETEAHTYGSWQVTTTATEEHAGEQKRECNQCGYAQTQTIPKLEHVHAYGEEWLKDETGHWHECAADDGGKSETEEHTYGNWEEVQPATEQGAGVKKRVCSECGYEDTGVIPQLDHSHTYSEAWDKDETYHWHNCEKEDCTAVSGKAPHEWDDGEVTQDPTCIAKGVKTYNCTVSGCGGVKTEPVDEIPHSYSEAWSYDETYHYHECTTPGCDAKSARGPHIWSESGTVTRRPTAWEEGTTTYKCTTNGCSAVSEISIPIEPAEAHFGTEITSDHSYIQYYFATESKTYIQYCEFTFSGEATIKYHAYTVEIGDSVELVEVSSDTLKESGESAVLPAGTARLVVEVSSEAGTTINTTIKQAVGAPLNPEPLTLGTAKTHGFTDRGEYWYTFTLEQAEKVTLVSPQTASLTVTLYSEEGDLLGTVAQGIYVADLEAGKYLVKEDYRKSQDTCQASVLVREYSAEDLGKASGAPIAVTDGQTIQAVVGEGYRYYVFTTEKDGNLTVKPLPAADSDMDIRYYSDAGFNNQVVNFGNPDNPDSRYTFTLSENSSLWFRVDFADLSDTVTVAFEEAVEKVAYTVTVKNSAGAALPNIKLRVKNSAQAVVIDEIYSDAEGKITFNAVAGQYYVAYTKEDNYNSPYGSTTALLTDEITEKDLTLNNRTGVMNITVTAAGDPVKNVTVKLASNGDAERIFAEVETDDDGIARIYYDNKALVNFNFGTNKQGTITYFYFFLSGYDTDVYMWGQTTEYKSVNANNYLSSNNINITITDLLTKADHKFTVKYEGTGGSPETTADGVTVSIIDSSVSATEPVYTGTTDGNGEVTFNMFAKAYKVLVSGYASGYNYVTQLTTNTTSKVYSVVLYADRTFNITVTDYKGDKVSGVKLALYDGAVQLEGVDPVTTDGEGLATFSNVKAGSYTVKAEDGTEGLVIEGTVTTSLTQSDYNIKLVPENSATGQSGAEGKLHTQVTVGTTFVLAGNNTGAFRLTTTGDSAGVTVYELSLEKVGDDECYFESLSYSSSASQLKTGNDYVMVSGGEQNTSYEYDDGEKYTYGPEILSVETNADGKVVKIKVKMATRNNTLHFKINTGTTGYCKLKIEKTTATAD